ncbi:MAG: putative peroxiredoxin [Polaribacter sp.]
MYGLTQRSYQERHFDVNPTLDMIEQLSAKGVKFYQCGQSTEFIGIKKSELAPQISLAFFAMTMLTTLQASGYNLVPL